eukprot:COSAG06_NODE_215_length_20124_cov_3.931735_10_plen_66_part_00
MAQKKTVFLPPISGGVVQPAVAPRVLRENGATTEVRKRVVFIETSLYLSREACRGKNAHFYIYLS